MTSNQYLRSVRLISAPVGLWLESSAHQEAIQREFDIIRSSLSEHSVPNRLFALLTEFDERFGRFGQPARDDLRAAAETNQPTIDLTFEVPAEVAGAVRQLDEMLDAVDDYCREGDHLLTLASTPDQVLFRKWFLDEFVRQLENGLEPLPWQGSRETGHRSEASPPGHRDQHTTVVFTGELDLATASALRDAIQERRDQGLREMTVDLTGVTFMDSVGVSLLVSTHSRLQEEGVRLRLLVPHRLYTLLDISGLVEVLQPEVRST